MCPGQTSLCTTCPCTGSTRSSESTPLRPNQVSRQHGQGGGGGGRHLSSGLPSGRLQLEGEAVGRPLRPVRGSRGLHGLKGRRPLPAQGRWDATRAVLAGADGRQPLVCSPPRNSPCGEVSSAIVELHEQSTKARHCHRHECASTRVTSREDADPGLEAQKRNDPEAARVEAAAQSSVGARHGTSVTAGARAPWTSQGPRDILSRVNGCSRHLYLLRPHGTSEHRQGSEPRAQCCPGRRAHPDRGVPRAPTAGVSVTAGAKAAVRTGGVRGEEPQLQPHC